MATRGPSGGGHLPFVWRAVRSGCDIAEPVAERFEDVALADLVGAVEVGRGPGDAPGTVESAGREAALLGPALEGLARGGIEGGHLAQAGGFELGVEAALA